MGSSDGLHLAFSQTLGEEGLVVREGDVVVRDHREHRHLKLALQGLGVTKLVGIELTVFEEQPKLHDDLDHVLQ